MNKSGNEAELKASVTLTGDGTTKEYYFGFDYLNPEYIKVAVGGTSLSYPTDYSVVDRKVILTEVPEKGAEIWIHRQTESSRIIQWADGAFIKASQMTLESLQQLHLIEETQDYIMLNSISTYPDGENFNALGHRIINVADPTEAQDAVTKHYMESVQDGFVQRNQTIETNVKSMQTDVTTKQQQAASSQTASASSAALSKAWAVSTESPDSGADSDSATGKTQSSRTWALFSKTKAQESATSATNAHTSETNAKTSETNAKASETKAKTSETNAKDSETKAKTSETNAKTSENAASTSATNAHTSETNAKTSETNAKASEVDAAKSASHAEEVAGNIGNPVSNVTESNGLVTVTKTNGATNTFYAGLNILARNKTYSVGDIAYSPNLPSWAYLECTTAGTTGATEPDFSTVTTKKTITILSKFTVSDGTCTWRLRDTRCKYEVGDIIPKVGSPKDYEYLIMADGGAFDAAYTELAKVFTDGKVPNLQDGRFLEGGANARQIKGAGLPNITGMIGDSVGSAGLFWGLYGAFYGDKTYGYRSIGQNLATTAVGAETHFDASRSNPIYGSSDTVQPKSYTVNYYICYGG